MALPQYDYKQYSMEPSRHAPVLLTGMSVKSYTYPFLKLQYPNTTTNECITVNSDRCIVTKLNGTSDCSSYAKDYDLREGDVVDVSWIVGPYQHPLSSALVDYVRHSPASWKVAPLDQKIWDTLSQLGIPGWIAFSDDPQVKLIPKGGINQDGPRNASLENAPIAVMAQLISMGLSLTRRVEPPYCFWHIESEDGTAAVSVTSVDEVRTIIDAIILGEDVKFVPIGES